MIGDINFPISNEKIVSLYVGDHSMNMFISHDEIYLLTSGTMFMISCSQSQSLLKAAAAALKDDVSSPADDIIKTSYERLIDVLDIRQHAQNDPKLNKYIKILWTTLLGSAEATHSSDRSHAIGDMTLGTHGTEQLRSNHRNLYSLFDNDRSISQEELQIRKMVRMLCPTSIRPSNGPDRKSDDTKRDIALKITKDELIDISKQVIESMISHTINSIQENEGLESVNPMVSCSLQHPATIRQSLDGAETTSNSQSIGMMSSLYALCILSLLLIPARENGCNSNSDDGRSMATSEAIDLSYPYDDLVIRAMATESFQYIDLTAFVSLTYSTCMSAGVRRTIRQYCIQVSLKCEI